MVAAAVNEPASEVMSIGVAIGVSIGIFTELMI